MDWTAIWLTLKLATLTTLILFVLGLPFSYWLSRTKIRGRAVIESLVALPLVLPPTVLGFFILYATGPSGWLGGTLETWTGQRIPFSFAGILMGSVLFNVPFAIRPFTAAFAGLDQKLVEAAWCLGESKWRTFWRITMPLCRPGILSGLVLTFAHTIGEFGVVLMIGGNIPGVTRTLSVAIYDDVQALNYAAAAQTSIMLLLFSLLLLTLTQVLTTRRGVGI